MWRTEQYKSTNIWRRCVQQKPPARFVLSRRAWRYNWKRCYGSRPGTLAAHNYLMFISICIKCICIYTGSVEAWSSKLAARSLEFWEMENSRGKQKAEVPWALFWWWLLLLLGLVLLLFRVRRYFLWKDCR